MAELDEGRVRKVEDWEGEGGRSDGEAYKPSPEPETQTGPEAEQGPEGVEEVADHDITCPECGKSFEKSKIALHVSKAHGWRTWTSSMVKCNSCPMCQQVLSSTTAVRNHLKKWEENGTCPTVGNKSVFGCVEEQIGSWGCDACGESGIGSSDWNGHARAHLNYWYTNRGADASWESRFYKKVGKTQGKGGKGSGKVGGQSGSALAAVSVLGMLQGTNAVCATRTEIGIIGGVARGVDGSGVFVNLPCRALQDVYNSEPIASKSSTCPDGGAVPRSDSSFFVGEKVHKDLYADFTRMATTKQRLEKEIGIADGMTAHCDSAGIVDVCAPDWLQSQTNRRCLDERGSQGSGRGGDQYSRATHRFPENCFDPVRAPSWTEDKEEHEKAMALDKKSGTMGEGRAVKKRRKRHRRHTQRKRQ